MTPHKCVYDGPLWLVWHVPFVLLMMSLVVSNYPKMSDFCMIFLYECCLFIYWVPYASSGEKFLNVKKFTISLLFLWFKIFGGGILSPLQ